MLLKIKELFVITLIWFLPLTILGQTSEHWHLDYYINQKNWEEEYVFTNRKGDTTTHLLYYDSIVTDNKKIRIKYFKFKKKFSTIEHYEISDGNTEIKNGPHLDFNKYGNIRYESTLKDGHKEETLYYFLYYPNRLPKIKYEQKGKTIWNVIEYFLPNGKRYTNFGDLKNGKGTLNMITDYKIESPEDFPIIYQFYFNKKGKQKKRVIN